MSEYRKLKMTILLAGAAALAPVMVTAQPVRLAVGGKLATFTPSDAPMVLTRTVRRALPGGKELIARRSYAVRIVRQSQGYRVEGELIASEVDAPPPLAELAQLERSRPDAGIFPIVLDAQGQIISMPPAQRSRERDMAANIVSVEASRKVASGSDQSQVRSFVHHVQQNGAGSQWPADLFHPAPGPRSETTLLDAGGGQDGRVTVSVNAEAAADSGLLLRLVRSVRTELAGTVRLSSEEWTLTPAG